RLVADLGCAREQLLGTGRAAQEGEVGQAVQLGVGRQSVLHWRVVVGGRGQPAQAARGFPGARRATAGRVAIDAVLVSHGAGTRGPSRRALPAPPTPTLPRPRGREQQRVRPASTPSPACGGRPGWGRAAGARWMTRASALPPPQPSPARGGGSRNAFTKTTPAASSGPARPAGRRPRRAGPARFR